MSKLIVTVCKGNIQRSVLTELCIRRELSRLGLTGKYAVESRGIQGMPGEAKSEHPNLMMYEKVWPLVVPVLAERGITWPLDKRSTPITREIAEQASIIYAMDTEVFDKLHRSFPFAANRIKRFGELIGGNGDVTDPHEMKTVEGHRSVVGMIDSIVRTRITEIIRHCG